MNIIERLKSPIVITNVVAGIVGILMNLGIIETGDTIQSVANAIIGILIVIGVLNNPTDKEGF